MLYGTTVAGGSSGAGTVFQLTPQTGGVWTEAVLYSFKGGTDGNEPQGGVVVGKGGVLYGTTFGGGTGAAGTVFQLTPPAGGGAWSDKVIYDFKGGRDGNGPHSDLTVRNGILYGTTCCGTEGTVFELHPKNGTWTKHTVFSFTRFSMGATPGGLVMDANGVLYGATSAGGSSGAGIVYSLTPPAAKGTLWIQTTIYSYTSGSDGGAPYGALTVGPNGWLY